MIFFVSHNIPKEMNRPKYKEYVRQRDKYGRWTYCNYDIHLEVNDTLYYTLGMIQDNGFTYRHVYNAFTVEAGCDGKNRLIARQMPHKISR